MQKRAYSYLRFSTAQQKHGDSLRRQTEGAERYAKEHGLTLDDSLKLQDLGTSAFKGKNLTEGTLGSFIGAAEKGIVKPGSYLLVENFDRLSRQSMLSALGLLQRILSLGITVVTLQSGMEFKPESLDDLPSLILALMSMNTAHEESVKKSRRIGASWSAKRKRASATGEPLTSRLPAWITRDGPKGGLKLDPENVKVIRRIFQEAAKGVGHHRLATILTTDRVPPIGRAEVWHDSYIQKILSNPAVIGQFQPHRLVDGKRVPEGEPIENYFPAAIKESLFLRVRDQRSNRRLPPGRKSDGRTGGGNLFTGLIRCTQCDSTMHFINKGRGKKGGAYLVCSKARRGGGCEYRGWNYRDFEPVVLFALNRQVDWSGLAPQLTEQAKTVITQLEEERASTLIAKQASERKAANIATQLEGLPSQSPTLLKNLADHEHAIESLDAVIKQYDAQLTIERDKVTRATETAASARRAFASFAAYYMTGGDPGYSRPRKNEAPDQVQEARLRMASVLREHLEVIKLHPDGPADPEGFKGGRLIEIHFRSNLNTPIGIWFDYAVGVFRRAEQTLLTHIAVDAFPEAGGTPSSPSDDMAITQQRRKKHTPSRAIKRGR